MNNILVFQAKEMIFPIGVKAHELKETFHKEGYEMVAKVATESLETAYRLTNTIEDYWWNNEEVESQFDGEGCRSTSVGDILMTPDAAYYVDSFGFKEIALFS